MPVFGPPQVMFVRGRGTELWDSEGRRYLDFLGGLAVIGLGHAHPAVAEAIAEQAGELLHVSNLFANPVATRAAIEVDRLLAEATGDTGQVFFTNSGAEAVECAIKLARKHGGRGRHTVVSALRELPRPHARRPRGDRPADQARAVPADAGGLPPRRVGRRRRGGRRGRRVGGRGPRRAGAGRGRGQPGPRRLPRRAAPHLRRDGSAADARRDPDRVRPHRALVRVRARRRAPRRRDPGQGDGQRHAGRRLLGPRATSPPSSSRATTAAPTAARRSPPRPSTR